MRQPRPQMIAGAVEKNLRLIFQPAKGARMDDPRTVALKFRAEIMTRLGIFSPARFTGFLRKRSEDAALVRFHFFPSLPFAARNLRPARIFGHGKEYPSQLVILRVWN